MRITKLVLVLVLVPGLGLVACAEQAGEEGAQTMEMAMSVDMEALGEAIAEVNANWAEAFQAGDAATLAAMYTEDAFRLAPNEPTLRGREAMEQAFVTLMESTTARTITINTTEYGGAGNLAYSIGTYAVTYEAEAGSDQEEGKYLVLSKLGDDGSWKIYAHMWSSDIPLEE
ncbi:MAG: SgcJ/EcaC family oxidoreductase [Gemmatimonadota bacterium]|nr:MAG: SgcJ/EcaC family oxidoreductase [Gemmatimonadota bacterium]